MTKRLAVAFLLFLSGSVLRADINFMVQGRLSDNTGNPIGTPTAVEWRLFRDKDEFRRARHLRRFSPGFPGHDQQRHFVRL